MRDASLACVGGTREIVESLGQAPFQFNATMRNVAPMMPTRVFSLRAF